MKHNLRADIIRIILSEAYHYNDGYIEAWLAGKFDSNNPRPSLDDREAMDAANMICNRLEARCSKIED